MPKNYDCYAIKVKFDNASNAHNKYKCDDITFPFPPSTFFYACEEWERKVLDTYSARGLMWKTFSFFTGNSFKIIIVYFISQKNIRRRRTTRISWDDLSAEFHVRKRSEGKRHKAPESKYFFQRRLYSSEQFQFFAAAIKNHVKECMRDLMP